MKIVNEGKKDGTVRNEQNNRDGRDERREG